MPVVICYVPIIFISFLFYVCFLVVYVLLSSCVFCVFVLFCVLFLPMYIVVYYLFVYSFTDLCHQVETKLQLLKIISYQTCICFLSPVVRVQGSDYVS